METHNYLIYRIMQVIEPSFLKIIVSFVLSTCFFFFGHLYNDALVAIGMLMIFDTALAMIAVYYYERDRITSRKFGRVVEKGIVYFIGISAGYFADLTIPFDMIQGTMVAFVGTTEFISILENIGRLGYETPKKLLNQLHAYKDKK